MMEVMRSSLSSWVDHRLLAISLVDVFCILGAVLIISVSKYAGMWMYSLVALPGTLAHELAHFVVALVLGARPSFPSLVPIRTEHGWRLGSVTFRVGRLRALPIALAPFVLLPLALWWAGSFLQSTSWPLYFLHVWVVAALVTASLPSKADFKLALPALIVAVVIALIVWMIW
jgi:hypothetical protein